MFNKHTFVYLCATNQANVIDMDFVIFIVFVAAFLLFWTWWVYGGVTEAVGEILNGLFPKAPVEKGDKVNVFLNGAYNRKATVTGVSDGRLYIYDGKLGLPIDYRGRFYAVGIDPADGSRLVYLGDKRHYRLVRAAEWVRTKFPVMDDEDMLPVTDEVEQSPSVRDETDEEGEDDG